MKALTAENVSFTYQGKYQKVNALKDVSCSFNQGRFYAITGPSGSGKTTFLSMLAGLGRPTNGDILADGVSIGRLGLERHRRENVSVIYQSFHLFPLLSVLDNVMYPMQIVHKDKQEIQKKAGELLESVGISPEYYKKLPAMLSGGEQQRVAIARALASDSNFLLADEPTGNLDSENGQKIIDLFKQLIQKGYCVIVVTHDLNIAAQTDIIYRMEDGKLIGKGDE